MPVKSKVRSKSGQSMAKPDSKLAKPDKKSKIAPATSRTAAAAAKPVSPASRAKTQSSTTSTDRHAAAAAKKSSGATVGSAPAAAIPAQKHAIHSKNTQQRMPMAALSGSKAQSSKVQPGVKASVKAVPAKPANVKSAAAKPAQAAANSAPAKPTVAKPAAAVKNVGKPAPASVGQAIGVAQFQAQRQAAVKPAAARALPAAMGNSTAQRISMPASTPPVTVVPAAAAVVAAHKDLAVKAPQAQPVLAAKKPISVRHGFKISEWIVYPAHGVGRIVAIEEQEIAGMALELFVITFEKDKMTLRVPTGKSASVGMRKLAEDVTVKRAMETLKGKARIKRTMWSRRAQEFEQKINSGDLVSIAEVVRDLFRAETQPEQSYSERQLYEAALDRMSREIAAVEKIDERGAVQRVTEVLSKSAKSRRAESEGTGGDIKAA